MPLGIVHAASEVVPFAKTGGLADVVGSVPRALSRRGHDCTVILPLYQCAKTGKVPVTPTELTFTVQIGDKTLPGRIWRSALPDRDRDQDDAGPVPVYLIEQADYFERDDSGGSRGLYQYREPNGQMKDYPDNCERFIFFSRAVLEALPLLDLRPDILHLHDWQMGLVPVYLREVYRQGPSASERDGYDRLRTVFTVHNIAYQGLFWHWDMKLTGLDWQLFNYRQLEFYGQLGFLKAGIVFSDWLTTVSPRYAQEIQTPYFGMGLQGVLAERRDRLTGIVNGVDYHVWNPATDRNLTAQYDLDSVTGGKPLCKGALQRRYGLPEDTTVPLLGMVARLEDQKGLDLLAKSADQLCQSGGSDGEPPPQLVVLGEGSAVYHRMLMELRARYPNQVGITLAFDEPLAHQIEAGADIYLMPSQFEPSGLNQLYSLKYGTIPVVRATGGLADTIVDCTPETLENGTATGFSFLPYDRDAFLGAVRRALEMYRREPQQWLHLIRTAMREDWSWDRSAAEYERVYEKVVEERG